MSRLFSIEDVGTLKARSSSEWRASRHGNPSGGPQNELLATLDELAYSDAPKQLALGE